MKDQEQYWADSERPYRYIPVGEFSEKFKKFHIGAAMLQELSVAFPKERSHQAALAREKYAMSITELFKTNFAKEVLLYKRNAVVSVFKILQVRLCSELAGQFHYSVACLHEIDQ